MILLVILSLVTISYAGSQSASMIVTATVLPVVNFSVTPLSFGGYDFSDPQGAFGTSSISLELPVAWPFGVAMNSGGFYGVNAPHRKMQGENSGDYIDYSVEHDSSGLYGSYDWGSYDSAGQFTANGTPGDAPGMPSPHPADMAYGNGQGGGTTVQITAQGNIAPNQDVTPDDYSDNVDVWLLY
ncbi:spore coat protein U domain-containing protein [Thermodesulfobacteriota bacterium]